MTNEESKTAWALYYKIFESKDRAFPSATTSRCFPLGQALHPTHKY